MNRKLRRFPLMEKKSGKEVPLEIRGRRPASLKHPEKGDALFLESYHRALAVHNRLLEDTLSKKSVEDLTQRIIEAKTGSEYVFPDAARLYENTPDTLDRRLRAVLAAAGFRDAEPTENGAKSRDEQMREIIEGVKPRTWKKDKARLLALLDGKE